MVHCDYASILHRYGDMASQKLHGRMDARADAQVILYSVQCNALEWTDNKTFLMRDKMKMMMIGIRTYQINP